MQQSTPSLSSSCELVGSQTDGERAERRRGLQHQIQSLHLLTSSCAVFARQGNDELGKHAKRSLYVDPATMLFDDDVVGYRETEPCPFSGWLGGVRRIEHLFSHLG